MLMDAGMIGGSAVPQGVVTTAGPAAAIASGAPAASSIAIPQLLADGAALASGVAALVLPWNEDKATELTDLYNPPFEGGQCEGARYQISYTLSSPGLGPLNNTLSPALWGPVSFDGVSLVGTDWLISFSGGEAPAGYTGPTTPSQLTSSRSASVTRGEPKISDINAEPISGNNDCGSPEPELQPGEVPSPDRMDELFGTPQQVPFPTSQPGPDGEPDTGDDIYPPLILPGPTISPDTDGNPAYSPSDLTIPNPADPNYDPGTDPGGDSGTDPGTDPDPQPEVEPFPRELFEGEPLDTQPLESVNFDAPHFIPYAFQVFSTKFPLDAIGSLPDGTERVCPVFSFFGESFEFCIINDAMDALKVPVLVSFVIWALMAL